MEHEKLTYSEMLKLSASELTQAEKGLRLQMNVGKLDIYGIKGKRKSAKGLRKSLARVLTAKNQNKSKSKKS